MYLIRSFPDTLENHGNGQYSLKTRLPAQVLHSFGNTSTDGDARQSARCLLCCGAPTGWYLPGRKAFGVLGNRSELTATGVRKQTLNGQPPPSGQTVLQFLLALPAAEEVTFSFSMGLPDISCSLDGLFFKVLLNGQDPI